MEKNLYQLIGEITSLGVIISEKTISDVFVRYNGHVNLIEIYIYPEGYKNNNNFMINEKFYLDSDINKFPNKFCNKIKCQFLKILKLGKVDLTVLPFDIEIVEVKNYKLIDRSVNND